MLGPLLFLIFISDFSSEMCSNLTFCRRRTLFENNTQELPEHGKGNVVYQLEMGFNPESL